MVSPGRVRAVVLLCAFTIALLFTALGCSDEKRPSDTRPGSTTTAFEPYLICDLIDLALDPMRRDGVSFVDLLDGPSGTKDDGARAMVALGLMARGRKQAGPFKPVLVFLAKRSVAESSSDAGKPPRLTELIRANAQRLDRFVADGRCG